jgi:hypothetical protein
VSKPPIAAYALATVLGTLVAASCGNDAVGVDACRHIEDARCRRAPDCGIPLEPPYHTAGNDVDGCIRFYDTACLHGLATGNPGGSAVNDCVAAIQATTDCTGVRSPQTLPACTWLGGSVSTADAAAGVDAASMVDAASADATGSDAPIE